MVRLINCLNGFSEFVDIKIHDYEQMGNIIFMVKDKLRNGYTVDKHIDEMINE